MDALAFSTSVSGKIEDDVLLVSIDNPPVNALSAHVRQGLTEALDHAATLEAITGVVITGAGRIFIGGADITEFGKPPVEPSLPEIIERIENFAKPVVAAVNGAALGGGCEIALACHGRIAGEKAGFGLPEVKLGIVPGAGGTQRLPRLIGLPQAIDLIGSGRTVKPAEALELGLADDMAADPLDAALPLVRTMAGQPLRRTGMLPVPVAEQAAVDTATRKILSKARGQAAPAEAVRLITAAAHNNLETGLTDERATFLRLRDSEESAALRHVFFAERSAGKVEKLDGVTPRKIETVGIVGTGLMGAGIAVAALTTGYRVIGVEQTNEAAEQGRERIAGILEKSVQSKRLAPAMRDDCLARLTVTADTSELAAADLVIEAVFDDLDVKTGLFQKLDGIVRKDAILATNTSYLDPDLIAARTARPERVVGLHFFSPAHIMRLVEVVDCKATEPQVLAGALAFAKRLGKLPIVCGVTEGFIGNRIFSAYRREAEFMVEDGAAPEQVDAALEAYGFPMGIFAVNDMAGLEIAWARRKRQAASRDPDARYIETADRLCEAGRLGRKAGRGWYDYSSGERAVDPQVTALIEAARAAKNIVPRAFTDEEIVTRLLKAMADEGAALLAEGIAIRSSDIDLVMINGYGFPAHKGGPMFSASR
ncbi:3-hydroxyacyl-CoA dehydrogenase NAD-binding domain-containing protein [Rhizobium sp. Root482]|uniref:3-hydroxyacyl-CoA dehydrogenase NAD-binding domain-containing protein n=1 Tax=Rhizobium sp. Root482 TaxID=1736543 RepID=UPI0006F2F213|nr:3-hydroxyacyl-CoA dehydrogenase NAD-binding domain-containing protein [Rhizobium sp. Root482]KQY13892.1 3-hydroxyacyl-CoA dehydrogenase [Rhizobium sp. Root482]